MNVNGVSGFETLRTLDNGSGSISATKSQSESNRFQNLLSEMTSKKADSSKSNTVTGVSSSQISYAHRLNGDYKQGFYGVFTSESDKHASPQGFAANTKTADGRTPVIDKTSDLYAQSLEMENYLVKMMMSSMRSTISHTSLSGDENSYARDMYEDMLYDNLAESLTKSGNFGIADQIYIELSAKA